MPRNGKYQTEFWREYSQKHVDDSRKEQVKYISVIFMVKNKCKRNGNKWRKGKADHIKKHMREAKRGNGPSKNRGSGFRKDDKYRAKNGSGKKNVSCYGPEGYFCRRQKLIAAWLTYSL